MAIGLRGDRRKLDVGRFDGERFAVMAGAGFDALMIAQADGTLKDRFGRVAYVWTGSKNLRAKPFKAKIEIDGAPWYAGDASCILVGNVGHLFGGVEVFEDARPDDGRLELGVVNADGITDWVRTLARTAPGMRNVRRSSRRRRRRRSRSSSNARCSTRSTAATERRSSPSRSRSSPPAITVCVPREGGRMARSNLIPPRRAQARSAGEGFVTHTPFAILSRAGFVARGLVYGIIGLLALDLALGHGGKITNQQGALRTVEHHSFGHLLLALLAIGLGGYSLWRLFRAALGHGSRGRRPRHRAARRARQRHRLRASCAQSPSRSSSARAAVGKARRRRRTTSSAGRRAAGSSGSPGS